MMTPLHRLLLLAPVVLLAACASKPSCDKKEPHLAARSGPEVELPGASGRSAWTIPAGGATESGRDMRRRSDGSCLDVPPPFVPPADAAQ